MKRIDDFCKYLKHQNYSKNTVESYRNHLRHFVKFMIEENITVEEVTTRDIAEYRDLIAEKYADSTVNSKLSVLKEYFDYLIAFEFVNVSNPVLSVFRVRQKKRLSKALSSKDKRLCLEYFKKQSDVIYLCFSVLFETGLRVSELVNLTVDDVQIADDIVCLNVVNAKRDSARLVPILDKKVANNLLDHIADIPSFYIFDRTVRALQYQAEKCREDLNIDFTVHSTRHTFATEKVREDFPIHLLQKILGHKDISTTMFYVDVDNRDVINYLNR